MGIRFFYVPMPISEDGHGPADFGETVKTIHQVWDEENIAFCSCDRKEYADVIVAALNREDNDSRTIRSLVSALVDCEDYFDNKADADCDQDGFVPNEEMRLLSTVKEAISLSESQSSASMASIFSAAKGLKRIVEEIDGTMNHGTWRDAHGRRLKDTPEWVALYTSIAKAVGSQP